MTIMKRTLNRLTTAAAVVFLALVGVSMWEGGPLDWIFSVGKPAAVDFKTLERTPNPNQFLMCPPGYCAAPMERASPVYDVPVAALRAAWVKVVAAAPRVTVRGEDPQAQTIDYVQRSALLRYPDLVTAEFIALGAGQSTLAVYSRSIYGRSDFGVNEKRVTDWLAKLDAALKSGKS